MRPFPALGLMLPLLATPALRAEDPLDGNRVGLAFALVKPTGSGFDGFKTGYQGSLQIHFNRESPWLGRLRIDYMAVDSDGPQVRGFYYYAGPGGSLPRIVDLRREGYGVAYEWMPHFGGTSRSGAFGILGVGGMLWNERQKALLSPAFSYESVSRTDSDFAFTPSLGFGYRFNIHAALEARVVGSYLNHRGDPPEWTSSGERTYLAFGASFRF